MSTRGPRFQQVTLQFIALDSNPDWRQLRLDLRHKGTAGSIAVSVGDRDTTAELIAPGALRAFIREVEELDLQTMVRECDLAAADLPGCDGIALNFQLTETDGTVTSREIEWLNYHRVPAVTALIEAVRRVVAETPLPRAAHVLVARLSDYLGR